MRSTLCACAALLCLSLPAAGQDRSDCPVAADMQRGIELERQNPRFDMVLRKDGSTVTEDRIMVANGKRRRVKTTYLHGLVPLTRREGNQVIEQKLVTTNTAFFAGGKVRKWSSSIEVRINGKFLAKGTTSIRPKGNATWTGNGCSYKVRRVVVSTKIEGRPTAHFEYFFALDLGVALGGYKLGQDGRTRVQSVLPERIARR